MQNGGQTDVIVMDFSKAFDKVPHQELLYKLSNYGINIVTLSWLKGFLSNRKQRVVLEGVMSDQVPVSSGVPQGSVLGPILFLAYINDLPQYVKSKVRLFADDTVTYLAIKSSVDCIQLQQDLLSLENWESDWKEYAYKQPITTREHYKYSFYPRTISEWNKLPREIVLSSSLAAFKNAIFNMY